MRKLKVDEAMVNDLYDSLISIKTREDCEAFLDDLCTKNEVEQMACRIRAARLLMEDKTYNEIIQETNISSATLSRVSKCIQYGKGYNRILKKKTSRTSHQK